MPTIRVKCRRVQKVRSKTQISFNMSRVRSTGSKIEQVMEAALREEKLKPKKYHDVIGKPDFAFPRDKVAVFCDSHFWHGYRWAAKQKEIRRNKSFWIPKIAANIKRDRRVNRQLKKEGWFVLRFWEHQILKSAQDCAAAVKRTLKSKRKGVWGF
jgi:DNA mismatch endonuclease Vsr